MVTSAVTTSMAKLDQCDFSQGFPDGMGWCDDETPTVCYQHKVVYGESFGKYVEINLCEPVEGDFYSFGEVQASVEKEKCRAFRLFLSLQQECTAYFEQYVSALKVADECLATESENPLYADFFEAKKEFDDAENSIDEMLPVGENLDALLRAIEAAKKIKSTNIPKKADFNGKASNPFSVPKNWLGWAGVSIGDFFVPSRDGTNWLVKTKDGKYVFGTGERPVECGGDGVNLYAKDMLASEMNLNNEFGKIVKIMEYFWSLDLSIKNVDTTQLRWSWAECE